MGKESYYIMYNPPFISEAWYGRWNLINILADLGSRTFLAGLPYHG